MNLTEDQVDFIRAAAQSGLPVDKLSPDQLKTAEDLTKLGAVVRAWKGLAVDTYRPTAAGLAALDAAAKARAGWTWFAGDNDETYRTGPCASREAAIAAAIHAGTGREYGEGPAQHTIYLIEARQDPVDLSSWIDVDAMVDNLHERLGDDLGGEDGESPAEGAWTDEQHADLETAIKAAVAAWQARHAIVVKPRQFTDSRNAERITIPEAVTPAPTEAPIVRRQIVDEVDQWPEGWRPGDPATVSLT